MRRFPRRPGCLWCCFARPHRRPCRVCSHVWPRLAVAPGAAAPRPSPLGPPPKKFQRCANCGRRRVLSTVAFCANCRTLPEVRAGEAGTDVPKARGRVRAGLYVHPVAPAEATGAPLGTDDRIRVLQARVARREALHHPGDSREIGRPSAATGELVTAGGAKRRGVFFKRGKYVVRITRAGRQYLRGPFEHPGQAERALDALLAELGAGAGVLRGAARAAASAG